MLLVTRKRKIRAHKASIHSLVTEFAGLRNTLGLFTENKERTGKLGYYLHSSKSNILPATSVFFII